jgi:hypothetical protein
MIGSISPDFVFKTIQKFIEDMNYCVVSENGPDAFAIEAVLRMFYLV